MKNIKKGVFCLIAAAVMIFAGCEKPPEPEVQDPEEASYPDPFEHRFAGYEHECAPGSGILGYLDEAHYGYYLTPEQKRGACTWYLWAGGDPLSKNASQPNAGGNPSFWRKAEARTWKIAQVSGLQVNINLLAFLDSRGRDQRFEHFGVLNDPGCKEASQPDIYGLWLDECEDPYSSGVMGLRLFPNKNFDPQRWDPKKYLTEDATIEPPYLAGLTCGICHIALDPVNPPQDRNIPNGKTSSVL